MQPLAPRITLSVGYQSGTRAVVAFLMLGVVLTITCGGLCGVTARSVLAGLLVAAPVMLFYGLLMRSILRAGGWLEGSRLTVVNVATRTVDLRAARSVSLRATGSVKRTPLLTVTTDARTVKLILRSGEGVLLPPGELVALAAALDTARCPGAAETAGWLRAVAAGPRTML
ncbi:hypothetical protein [Micromonospora sp. NBC_00421]|uniref:hypothetical protein n=1 Tax=Micromonospora sp. NBC_00421 TaxID=2975976 RepID=UPI002E23E24B